MVLEFQFTRPSALSRAYPEFEGYCALKAEGDERSLEIFHAWPFLKCFGCMFMSPDKFWDDKAIMSMTMH